MPTKSMQELRAAVEKAWLSRAEAQELKPGTMKYKRAEVEFFTGAMAALNAVEPSPVADGLGPLVPASWIFAIMRGDQVAK